MISYWLYWQFGDLSHPQLWQKCKASDRETNSPGRFSGQPAKNKDFCFQQTGKSNWSWSKSHKRATCFYPWVPTLIFHSSCNIELIWIRKEIFEVIPKTLTWRKNLHFAFWSAFCYWYLLIKERSCQTKQEMVTHCQENCGQKVMTAIPSFVISYSLLLKR